MPPLELDLPIAFSTDEIGDDGGSSSGTGGAARSAVGDSGFTLPVGGRARCVFAPAGVGGGFAARGGDGDDAGDGRDAGEVGDGPDAGDGEDAGDAGDAGDFPMPFVSIAAVEARLTVLTLPVVAAPADLVTGALGAVADSFTSFASASSWTTGVCWSSCHSASSIASSSRIGVSVGVFVGFVIA
jgi:hypothetical protein